MIRRRFISADDMAYLGADGTITGYNLFAYCDNSPVNNYDNDGTLSKSNCIKLAIGAVALAGAIALTVATGGGTAVVAVGVAKVVGSVALGTAVGAGVGYLQNGKQGAIDGACDGFMWGSIAACGAAALKYVKVKGIGVHQGGTGNKFNDLLNSEYYKTHPGFDCSEIAEEFYDAANRQGKIYRIEGKNGIINGYEYGNIEEYLYHEVYSDGINVYDPRYSNMPVPKGDYFRMLREINIDGFDVFERIIE